MTHAAVLSGKYKNFIANDIDSSIIQLLKDASQGLYDDRSEFVTREQFFAMKDSDPYVRWFWSFCNDGKSYAFSKDKEPVWKAIYKVMYSRGEDEIAKI